MRRFTETRYIPYLRTRYPMRARCGIPTSMKEFLFFLRIIVCIVCLVATLRSVYGNFYEVVEKTIEYQTPQLLNAYIDKGVLMTTSYYDDASFINIGKNSNGKVMSVETNTMEVNRFAAELSENILKEIQDNKKVNVKVPLGSLVSDGLISSFGFPVAYRIVPTGKVSVVPESTFQSAGINQTIHRLMMKVCVNVKILFPLVTKEEGMTRDVLVSETIMIGDVPERIWDSNTNASIDKR